MIVGPAKARLLHLLYQQIDFKSLRPLFTETCQRDKDGSEYYAVTCFENLVVYVQKLDMLVAEAEATVKCLTFIAGDRE